VVLILQPLCTQTAPNEASRYANMKPQHASSSTSDLVNIDILVVAAVVSVFVEFDIIIHALVSVPTQKSGKSALVL